MEKLQKIDNPDFVIVHAPEQCQSCGRSLNHSDGNVVEAGQVLDTPKPKIES